jgi:hypothetical protein
MVKIYRPADRIEVKIGEVVVKLAPLTLHQKTAIQAAMMEGRKSGDIREATRGIALAMKYSLKSIKGLHDSDENEYALQFNGQELSDECVDDLMNIEISNQLALVCSSMAAGVPKSFNLEGVEILKMSKDVPEKKN